MFNELSEITTVAQAKKYADCPNHHQYKCSYCGEIREIDTTLSYISQSKCSNCGGQMMGIGWAGWYNHWRDLAIYLLQKETK